MSGVLTLGTFFGWSNDINAITAVLGEQGGAYPHEAPQHAQLPYIVYQVITDPGYYILDGVANIRRPLLQVESWGASVKEAQQLADAVREEFSAFRGEMQVPYAFEQITVGSTVVSLDSDLYVDSLAAYMTLENASIRYTVDGTTPDNAQDGDGDVGHLLLNGYSLTLSTQDEVENFLAIRASGGFDAYLRVTYTRGLWVHGMFVRDERPGVEDPRDGSQRKRHFVQQDFELFRGS